MITSTYTYVCAQGCKNNHNIFQLVLPYYSQKFTLLISQNHLTCMCKLKFVEKLLKLTELSTLEQKILNIQLGYFLCIFLHVFVFKICIFIFVHNKLLRNKLFYNNYVHVQCILSHPMTAKLI